MLVKQTPEAEWTYFYGSIEGFAYEPGGGSFVAYRLVRVLAKAPESNAI